MLGLRRLRGNDLTRLAEALVREVGAERAAAVAAALDPPLALAVPSLETTTPAQAQAQAEAPPRAQEEPTTKRARATASPSRPFDFSRFATRKVALWLAYWGEAYHGFTTSGSADDGTVESALFAALSRTKLVDESKGRGGAAWEYSRCGRTDRGVSAFAQVVALRVRSNGASEPAQELDYVTTINKALPNDVAVLAWAPVPAEFDARFSCVARTYRYAFVPRPGMDLDRMRAAAKLFVGTHDFRNFCKMDVEQAAHFTRTIESFEVVALGPDAAYAEVTGNSFLWHQVRMMMAVLFLVARGLEEPAVVARLLDAEAVPRRPNYEMASDEPLVLFGARFRSEHDPKWVRGGDAAAARTQAAAERRWAAHVRGATTARLLLGMLRSPPLAMPAFEPESDHAEACLRGDSGSSARTHTELLKRKGGLTFEEKVAALPEAKRADVLERARRAREFFAAKAAGGAAAAVLEGVDES